MAEVKEATSEPEQVCLAGDKATEVTEEGPGRLSRIGISYGGVTVGMDVGMCTSLPDLWQCVRMELCLESCEGCALLNLHDRRQAIRNNGDFLRLMNSEPACVVVSGVVRGGASESKTSEVSWA